MIAKVYFSVNAFVSLIACMPTVRTKPSIFIFLPSRHLQRRSFPPCLRGRTYARRYRSPAYFPLDHRCRFSSAATRLKPFLSLARALGAQPSIALPPSLAFVGGARRFARVPRPAGVSRASIDQDQTRAGEAI